MANLTEGGSDIKFLLTRDEAAVFESQTVEGYMLRFVIKAQLAHGIDSKNVSEQTQALQKKLSDLEAKFPSLEEIAREQFAESLPELARQIIKTREDIITAETNSKAAVQIKENNYPNIREAIVELWQKNKGGTPIPSEIQALLDRPRQRELQAGENTTTQDSLMLALMLAVLDTTGEEEAAEPQPVEEVTEREVEENVAPPKPEKKVKEEI